MLEVVWLVVCIVFCVFVRMRVCVCESMFVGRIRVARGRFGMRVAGSVAWAVGYASEFVTVGTCLCVCMWVEAW